MFEIVLSGFIFMILYVMYLSVKKDDYADGGKEKFDPRKYQPKKKP
ncbi:hypothetical protein [Emcibacter sp.]|nr:hypothetical protein [Emcibacter sp.]